MVKKKIDYPYGGKATSPSNRKEVGGTYTDNRGSQESNAEQYTPKQTTKREVIGIDEAINPKKKQED